MKISTEIGSAAHLIGEERAIESLAKAGFDAWDFSMFDMCRYDWSRKVFLPSDHPLASTDYLKFARKLKQIGLDNGIVCTFPFQCGHTAVFEAGDRMYGRSGR